jgi:hypothetical protein
LAEKMKKFSPPAFAGASSEDSENTEIIRFFLPQRKAGIWAGEIEKLWIVKGG